MASTLAAALDPPSGRIVRRIGMTQTLLTPAQIDALVVAYAAGEKISALAARFGIHRNTVTAHLRRRGAQRPRGLSAQQVAQAAVLCVEQQWTLEDTAELRSESPDSQTSKRIGGAALESRE